MGLSATVLESLKILPSHLRGVARGRSQMALLQQPIAGGFSLLEHACHLRDYEKEGCQTRVDRILTERQPTLGSFEGDLLAIERRYREQDFAAALDQFIALRTQSLQRYVALSTEQLARTTDFADMGVITLRRLIDVIADHDAVHRREIDELAAELEQQAVA